MLYPIAGSADVADGNFTLVLEYAYGLPEIGLAGATSGTALQPTAVPSPLPSPAATPESFASPAAYAVPALQRHTSYSVVFAAHACQPKFTIGTFTTQ